MTKRNLIGLSVLLVLLGVGARIVLTRGFGVRFSARPAVLAAPFTTEEAWVMDEIVSDIVEMSTFGANPPAAAPVVRQAAQAALYEVTLASSASPVSVDLNADLWSPSAFSGVARAALGASTGGPRPNAIDPVHPALRHLTAPVLMTESQRVDRALKADMRSSRAHEAAALVLAAFALREAPGRVSDTRWAMNRMTAHLAIAEALRGQDSAGVDGRLAEAVLGILANRQRRALEALDRIQAEVPGEAVGAWTRALRLHVTEDWRTLKHPEQASRLEQREYFRARRATVRTIQGSQDLEALGLPLDIDWVRIIQGYPVGVEDGSLVRETLDLERAELDDVYMRLHGRPLVDDETAALNAPATRCVNGSDVHVLPWGAWAEFAQRHIAVVIGRYDSYLRHSLGAGHAADTEKLALRAELGNLWVFPTATIWWTKGPRGLEADLRYIDEAIGEGVARPHRMIAKAWSFLELGSKYEPVRHAMPAASAWYLKPAPRAAYDAAARVQDSGHSLTVEELEALVSEAPYDWPLMSAYLTRRFGARAPLDEVTKRAGERMRYDTRPVAVALDLLGTDDRRIPILQAACSFSIGQCLPLANALAERGRDQEASHAYEAALTDPALDAVAKANWSGWLVEYYRSHGQVGPALRLAEESASTNASNGLVTAGRLYERLGRWSDAETMFSRNAEAYEAPAELVGFYYRAVNARKQSAYEDRLHDTLERVFPNGLERDPVAPVAPARGVYIEKDSVAARAAGLHAGDIIVAVDGWHVDSVAQYRVIRALSLDGGVALTIWRAGPSVVTIPDRRFVPEFRIVDYPVQGWIEK